MKKCLVTGANGFIGRNLVLWLEQAGYDVIPYHHSDGDALLEHCCRGCDIVFHLAGVNRPENPKEYEEGNAGFTKKLVDMLERSGNVCPVIFASSIQAGQNNHYGISKQHAEEILLEHAKAASTYVRIYRLPNVFGKWCRPNYNSAIATFCYNKANELPLVVHDASRLMELVHVDDVMEEFLRVMEADLVKEDCYVEVPVVYRKTLGEIASMIQSFGKCRSLLQVPDHSDDFAMKLYSTYLSYLPTDNFSYPLKMHKDERGSFTEFVRTVGQGQFSVNVSRPHVVKGNHWHHTKHEKFLVVSGEGVIRLRKLGEDAVVTYQVSGKKLEVVEIPPGYTHNIENTGEHDMVTLMWANENYNPEKPDTWRMEV